MINDIEKIVINATNNFTKILSVNEIKEKYKELYWGGNGIGDRWAHKKFNYSVIFKNKNAILYSENENDTIPNDILANFLLNNNGKGIIGIYVHSIKNKIITRRINKKIQQEITKLSCVICGKKDTICDHKNDLYNDIRVLDINTQIIDDFQPLCNHCNLQKRQICKEEKINNKIYSAKNIQRYKVYDFNFPWELKNFDINDINCKLNTYWYDPIKFDENIYYYIKYTIPLITELKLMIKKGKIKFVQ